MLTGGRAALILHFAAVEAHVRIVSEAGRESIGEERRIPVKCGEAGSPITFLCEKLTHL